MDSGTIRGPKVDWGELLSIERCFSGQREFLQVYKAFLKNLLLAAKLTSVPLQNNS